MADVSRMPQVIRLGDHVGAEALDDRLDRPTVAWQRLVESGRDRLGRQTRRDAGRGVARAGEVGSNHVGEGASNGEIRVGLDRVENRRTL